MSVLTCEASENTPAACLLTENPNRLVSLWDIVRAIQPEEVIRSAQSLWIEAGLLFTPDPQKRAAVLDMARKDLDWCETVCGSLDLPMSGLQVKAAIEAFSLSPHTVTIDWLERVGNGITQSICNEMSLRKYFEIPQDKAKHYVDAEPLGSEVADKFPSTSYDGIEARRCFAQGRYTACVFHLMRVLEIGLRVLADRFNVPSDHTNWQNIIEGIEKAVRSMANAPNRSADWKDQQEFFAQTASHFMVIKDAWRNYTAHARGKYGDEEAETILINVRGFVQRLATRLHE